MAIKSFLSRAAAGTAARATSLVPLQKRLSAVESQLRKTDSKLNSIDQAMVKKVQSRDDAESALELSVDNEATAENRLARSTSDRDKASSKSDLRAAEKLSKRNRSARDKADRDISKLAVKRSAAKNKVDQVSDKVDRLRLQLAASKAAAPTRLTTARRKGLKIAKASPAKIRSAREKARKAKTNFDQARAEFTTAKNELFGITGKKSRGIRKKRRRNKFN